MIVVRVTSKDDQKILNDFHHFKKNRGVNMERRSEKPKIPFWSIKEEGQPIKPIFGFPTFNYSPLNQRERDPHAMSDHKWGILYQDVLLSGKQAGLTDNEFELVKVINKKEENEANYDEVRKALTFGF